MVEATKNADGTTTIRTDEKSLEWIEAILEIAALDPDTAPLTKQRAGEILSAIRTPARREGQG